MTQSDAGIDTCCSRGGNVRSHSSEGKDKECQRDDRRESVGGRHRELRRDQGRQESGTYDAADEPGDGRHEPVLADKSDDIGVLRAQGYSRPDLTRPSSDVVSQRPVQTYQCERHTELTSNGEHRSRQSAWILFPRQLSRDRNCAGHHHGGVDLFHQRSQVLHQMGWLRAQPDDQRCKVRRVRRVHGKGRPTGRSHTNVSDDADYFDPLQRAVLIARQLKSYQLPKRRLSRPEVRSERR